MTTPLADPSRGELSGCRHCLDARLRGVDNYCDHAKTIEEWRQRQSQPTKFELKVREAIAYLVDAEASDHADIVAELWSDYGHASDAIRNLNNELDEIKFLRARLNILTRMEEW